MVKIEEIMDNFKATMGEANREKELMVFDWDKAARRIKESNCRNASAGLRLDWEYTGGEIYVNGEPTSKPYTYLASTWAIPELELDGTLEECYIMESETEWDSHTKWPQSALDILRGKANG